mmetsp:Transcript_23941/g.57944  ORF Transcript_23941/g.57944 Transcript_23941/m.57944 type:complete len:138 (+) Transcript_23941:171-584(+)
MSEKSQKKAQKIYLSLFFRAQSLPARKNTLEAFSSQKNRNRSYHLFQPFRKDEVWRNALKCLSTHIEMYFNLHIQCFVGHHSTFHSCVTSFHVNTAAYVPMSTRIETRKGDECIKLLLSSFKTNPSSQFMSYNRIGK